MAIISTETKASAARPGNNTGLSFNLSNQQEAYQGLTEDGVASLIKAEQFAAWHKISLCTDFLVVAESRAGLKRRRVTHSYLRPSDSKILIACSFICSRSMFDFLLLHFKVKIL